MTPLFFCAGVQLFALGGKAPEISGGYFLPKSDVLSDAYSKDEIRVTVDWSRARRPFDYKYALYRGALPQRAGGENGGSISPEVYKFVCFLPLPQPGSRVSSAADSGIKSGERYFYQIFYSSLEAATGVDGEGDAASIYVSKIHKDVYPKKINPYIIDSPSPQPLSSVKKSGAPGGIYVGIISFSDGAFDVTQKNIYGEQTGALIALETQRAKDAVINQFNSAYRGYSSARAALYYALHKAVVNISDAMETGGLLPDDIDSINIAVITGGSDLGSTDANLPPVKSKSGKFAISEARRNGAYGGYPEFLREIFSSGVNGVPVSLWRYGVPGGDFNESGAAEGDLFSVSGNHFRVMETGALPAALEEIPAALERLNSQTLVFASLPSVADGVRVAIRADEKTGAVIEGVVREENGAMCFTEASSTPPGLLSGLPESRSFKPISREGGVGYEFILNGSYYEGKTAESQSDCVFIQGGGSPLGGGSFVNFNRNPSFSERKTHIVYFVVDESKRLNESKAEGIKKAVFYAVQRLFDLNASFASASSEEIWPEEWLDSSLSVAAPPRTAIRNPPSLQNAMWTEDFIRLVKNSASQETPWLPPPKISAEGSLEEAGELGFYVQIAAFRNEEAAQTLRRVMETNGFVSVNVYASGISHKVQIGPFNEKTAAEKTLQDLLGIWEFIRKM